MSSEHQLVSPPPITKVIHHRGSKRKNRSHLVTKASVASKVAGFAVKEIEKAAISLQSSCIPSQKNDIESIQFMANAVQDMLVESRKDFQSSNDTLKITGAEESSSYQFALAKAALTNKRQLPVAVHAFSEKSLQLYKKIKFNNDDDITLISDNECESPSPQMIPTNLVFDPSNFIPPPSESFYKPYEIYKLIKETILHEKEKQWFPKDNERNIKGALMRFVLEKKYVNCKRTKLYDLLSTDGLTEENYGHRDWKDSSGRSAVVDCSVLIESLITKGNFANGATISNKEISKMIIASALELWVSSGKPRSTFKAPSSHQLHRAISIVRSDPRFNEYKRVSDKDKLREIAENSVRAALSYLFCVVTTHFFHGKFDKAYHVPREKMSTGAKLMYDLVLAFNPPKDNEDLIYVLPWLVTTTDETTVFATMGDVEDPDEFFLTVKEDPLCKKPDSSRRNIYHTGLTGDKHMRGLRICLNNTWNATGDAAPIWASIYGLSIDEMPGEEDIAVIPIEGLNMREDLSQTGYICFVRGKIDAETGENLEENDENNANASKQARVTDLYSKEVYYPFIDYIRKKYAGYTWDGISQVPSHLRAVAWIDGAQGQLSLLTSDSSLVEDDKRNIVRCKHNAKRTGVEQAADVSPAFRLLKYLVRHFTQIFTVNEKMLFLHQKTSFKFEELQESNQIVLPSFKRKSIVLFVSKLPQIMMKAYTRVHLMSGFLGNGMIDGESFSVPDGVEIMNTMRHDYIPFSNLSEDDELQYRDHFELLFQAFYDPMIVTGMISEEKFDENNIEKDHSNTGEIHERDFSISQEHRQRAKVLSHSMQREERKKLLLERRKASIIQQWDRYEAEQKVFEKNKECEDMLKQSIQRLANLNNQASVVLTLSNLVAAHFGEKPSKKYFFPGNDLLKSFLKVRSPQLVKLAKTGRVTYKVPLSSAEQKNRGSLILKCLELRDTAVVSPKIERPTVEKPTRTSDI